jgi:hypothetical protein
VRFAASLLSVYLIVVVVVVVVPVLFEEHSVTHPTELSECAGRALRVGDELESKAVACRPCHVCLAHQQLPGRTRRSDRPSACDGPVPMDIEACTRFDRNRHLEAEERVRKVEEVALGKVAGTHVRLALLEVDSMQADSSLRPEQSGWIGVNARVEVMDLAGEIREVILTSVEIQSNEPERPLMCTSVQSHVDAAHEPHVCVKKKRLF